MLEGEWLFRSFRLGKSMCSFGCADFFLRKVVQMLKKKKKSTKICQRLIQVCLELESYFDMLKIKIMLKAVKRRDVSGNVWHIRAYKHTQRSHRCSGWRFGRRRSAVNPGQDLFSHSASASSSVCLSAYLLTKELSLSLSWWISLNGDFPCNHMTLHQFSKKPQSLYDWTHILQGQSDIKQKGRLLLCGRSRYRHLAGLWRSVVLLVIRCESLSLSHPLPLFQPAADPDSACSRNCILVSSSRLCVLAVTVSRNITFHAFSWNPMEIELQMEQIFIFLCSPL